MKQYDPPALGEDERSLLDYLELSALASETHKSQIMSVIDDIRVQLENPEEDYGDEYLDEDHIFAAIEVRLNERTSVAWRRLPISPFRNRLRSGVRRHRKSRRKALIWAEGYFFLRRLPGGWDHDLKDLGILATQRIFQLVATIAVAGYIGGCAVSLGWPRRNKEELLSTLERAYQNGSSIQPLPAPSGLAPMAAKDGGIDARVDVARARRRVCIAADSLGTSRDWKRLAWKGCVT